MLVARLNLVVTARTPLHALCALALLAGTVASCGESKAGAGEPSLSQGLQDRIAEETAQLVDGVYARTLAERDTFVRNLTDLGERLAVELETQGAHAVDGGAELVERLELWAADLEAHQAVARERLDALADEPDAVWERLRREGLEVLRDAGDALGAPPPVLPRVDSAR